MTRTVVTLLSCSLAPCLASCRGSGANVDVTWEGHGAPGAVDAGSGVRRAADAGQASNGGAETNAPGSDGTAVPSTPILDDAGMPAVATLCPSFHGTSNALTLMGNRDEGLVFLRSDGNQSELAFDPLNYGWSWAWSDGWLGVYRYSNGGDWQAAVLSPLGDLSYRADGSFSDLRFNVLVESIDIDAAQTLTIDHEIRNSDGWLTTGPLGDLVVSPDGQGGGRGEQRYLGQQDVDGWVAAPFGLYHVETAERRELGEGLNDAAHTLRDGRWVAAEIENRDGSAVATILDATDSWEHELGPEIDDLFASRWVSDDALVALTFNEIPRLCFEQSTERATPLVTGDVSNPRFPYSDNDGVLPSSTGSTWLVSTDDKIAIAVSDLGAPDDARVHASDELWWLIVEGRPVLSVSRTTGEEASVDLDGLGDAAETFTSGDSLLVLSDGDLAATIDADTGFVRDVPGDGRAAVDRLHAYGAWIVGLSSGHPLWVVDASSHSTRALSDVPKSANDFLAVGSRLLLLEGTTPVAVLDEEGEVRPLEAEVVASLEPATALEVRGDWVFGLGARSSGGAWGDSAVWRVHLRTRELQPVPEPEGYVHVFDEAYVLDAGDENWPRPSDSFFDDGSVVTLRRTESAAQFLLFAGDGWTPLGNPMPEVVHGAVVHDANYFILTANDFDCFCAPPTTSWEPSDDPLISAQLVLLGEDGSSDVLTTVGNFPRGPVVHPDSPCIVWDTGEQLHAVDAPTRSSVELPDATYRWIAPER